MKGKIIVVNNNEEEHKAAPEASEEIEALVKAENKLIKKIDSETLEINSDKYAIKTNYRDALDIDLLEERYSDLLEKYDYIVGDMSYGKLRLRGFYYDSNKKAPIDMKISHLQDYLLEYCSFGCAYFVLESLETKNKKRSYPNTDSDYDEPARKAPKNRSDRSRKRPAKKNYNQSTKSASKPANKLGNKPASKPANKASGKPDHKPASRPSSKPKSKSAADKPQKSNEKKTFTKKNRSDNQSESKQTEKVKEVKNEKGNTRFQIRKKK
ncbi:MAG: DUF1027 domain-containing protein [Alkalibacterium sp.]|nr:DUF1027 domain-containing protein [Alkalibacterium sp.]